MGPFLSPALGVSCFLVAAPALLAAAQPPSVLEASLAGVDLSVQIVGRGILRVVAVPAGRPVRVPRSFAVLPGGATLPGRLVRTGAGVELQGEGIRARLDAATGGLAFLDGKGRPLLAEDPEGARTFQSAPEAFHIQAAFRLKEGEPLFGLGQQEDGILDRRGRSVRLLQSNKRMAVPFMASPGSGNGAWGLLWDNASRTEFQDGPGGTTLWSDVGEAVVYYVIAAQDLDGVLGGLRTLTGEVPLLPKWAFGFWQSKERYRTRDELVGVAEEYRRRGLPLDGVIQDWRYWGTLGWNAMGFDEAVFPDPKGMVDRLHALNTHLLISVWPNMETRTEVAQDLARQGLLVTPAGTTDEGGALGVYDAFSPEGRRTYWEHLRKGILSTGLDGLWMDATEPEFRSWTDDSILQESYVAESGAPNAGGSWASDLNAYPLMTVEGVTDNWRRTYPDRRPVVLTRSAFLGQGRTGCIVWSGDIASSFACMRRQIANGLNASLSGLPYWNTDIGGFFPAWFGGEYPRGVQDPAFRELFVRWFQMGAFHPMFRAHGSTTPREIWRFGEPGTEEYDALARMLRLRYRLLPYLYSTAAELRRGAGTFLRALAMDFPDAAGVQDQFLCGRSLLVSPVLEHQKVPEARQGRILDGASLDAPLRMGIFASDAPGLEPLKVTREPRAEFNWNLALPVGEAGTPFSLRLEGRLKPQEGPQVLSVGCMGGMRAWVDGKAVIDDWERGSFRVRHAPVALPAGADLRVEFHGSDSSHLVAGLESAAEARAPRPGRDVRLPRGTWFDFWTGEALSGGGTVWSAADLSTIPLHVKAGTLLPLGPDRNYALEKAEDPLELRIYPGADGRLELYEDDGVTRAHEKGAFSIIPFAWEDRAGVLRIGARRGHFPGMLGRRTLRIVRVGLGHGVGEGATVRPERTVIYRGKALTVNLRDRL